MLLERISTYSLQSTVMTSSRRLQAELQAAQTELSTGRHADVGVELASHVGRNILWRNRLASIESDLSRNNIAANRAQVSQSAIEAIKAAASDLRDAAMGARGARNGTELARIAGGNGLQTVMQLLSTTHSGEHVFSGLTADVAPLESYEGQPAQSAFDAAFVAEFGFSKNSGLAAGITPSQMQTFLDGRFEDLFRDPAWQANWSQSSYENMLTRVGEGTIVDISANANDVAFRDVLKGAVALHELGATAIGQGTFQVVADKAVVAISGADAKLGELQGRIGYGQEAAARSSERLEREKNIIEAAIARTEGVPDYEAATRLNALMTQLESSYAVTARISKLSLMNYL